MADKLFFHGKPVEGHVEVHEHISPVSMYLKVLIALFVLTALTYGVSFMDLGPASLPVAMLVAVAKASLVCAYFMHLKYDDRYHVFVFLSTLIFVGIFFTFTLFDLNSRTRSANEEQDTFFLRNYAPDAMPKKVPSADELPAAAPAEGAPVEGAGAMGEAADGKAAPAADGKAAPAGH